MIKARGITETEIAERMAEAERETTNDAARAYLRETDWMVLRMIEAGVDIPEEIREKRRKARERVT